MLTPAREQELMDKAINGFEAAGLPTMERDAASAYLTSVMTAAYELLRTVEDDDYIRAWLDSALVNLVNPPSFGIRKPS